MEPGQQAVRVGEELLLSLAFLSAAPVGDHDEQARVESDQRLNGLAAEGAHHRVRY